MIKKCSLLILLSFTCLAKDYYHWIDEKGIAHFSDKPFEQNTQVDKIPFSNPILMPKAASQINEKKENTKQNNPEFIATKIGIVSPKNEENIHNTQGNISILLKTDFPLEKKQYVQIYLNGKKLKKQKALFFTLENIDRGSHKIRVALFKGNKLQASSKEITLFLHRAIKTMPIAK